MCIPAAVIAGAGLLVQTGSAVASHIAAEKESKATRKSARRAGAAERRDITIRGAEETTATSRQIEDIRLSAQEAEGGIGAAGAEAGVKGSSLEAILGNLRAREGTAVQALREQNIVTLAQLERMKTGATAKEQARVAAAPRPSGFLTGLQIAGGVAGFAADQAARRKNVEGTN